MMRICKKTIFLLLMFTLSLDFAYAGSVTDFNYKTGLLKVAMSQKEQKSLRRGMSVRLIGVKAKMRSLGKIKKISKNMAYIDLKDGFYNWKAKDKLNVRNNKHLKKSHLARGFLARKKFVLPELGSAVYPVPSAGLTAGIEWTKDTLMELNVSFGEAIVGSDRFENDPFGVDTKLKSSVLSARVKKMWVGPLYSNIGLGYREIVFSGYVSGYTESSEAQFEDMKNGDEIFSDSRRDIVLDTAIGVRWQRFGITYGVDVAGVMVPVASLKGPSGDSSAVVLKSFQDAQGYHDYFEYDLPGVTYQAKVYFGWSF